jgi:glycosyltransferase involved in cell wall biosynthesis
MHQHKVVAIVPAYDEDKFIGSVVLKAKRYVDSVLVVDDCSTDATAEVAAAAGADVVRHATNRGKAGALNTAFRKARELDADVVVMLDGDGQHHPEDIPAVIRPILENRADLVVGSRFLTNTTSADIPAWRKVGQHGLTMITNVLSGFPLTDSQSGFRAMSRRAYEGLSFRQGGFTAESEMQFIARERKWTVTEIPIHVTGYEDGPKRNPVRHGVQVINGMLRLVGQSRPLLSFGVPGIALMIAGLLLGIRVVITYDATFQLAIGNAILTVLLTLLGSFSLFTGIILHSVKSLFNDYLR